MKTRQSKARKNGEVGKAGRRNGKTEHEEKEREMWEGRRIVGREEAGRKDDIQGREKEGRERDGISEGSQEFKEDRIKIEKYDKKLK